MRYLTTRHVAGSFPLFLSLAPWLTRKTNPLVGRYKYMMILDLGILRQGSLGPNDCELRLKLGPNCTAGKCNEGRKSSKRVPSVLFLLGFLPYLFINYSRNLDA